MSGAWSDFRSIWVVDFEFQAPDGERPDVVCLVAKELRSGRVLRLWRDDIDQLHEPPYAVGRDSLFIAYYSSAEFSCHLALGWALPVHVLDLYTEFRAHTNGLEPQHGNGLLGALLWFGREPMTSEAKQHGRQLVMRGGPWTEGERAEILDYCETDVHATAQLFEIMCDLIEWPYARLRGRYMKAVARVEHTGVPMDAALYRATVEEWDSIRDTVIARIDSEYGVFEKGVFKCALFGEYLERQGIHNWPRTPEGRLALSDDTFREYAKSHAQLQALRELRGSLAEMRRNPLAIGSDGRNRCLLSPFGARSGRNTPSATKYVFGPSVWMRSFIRPGPGRAFVYLDWEQQEWAIAGVLSGDANMLAAYGSGDPYLTFAKQAGAVPADATKATHGEVRELFKTCALGVNYGMSAEGLARRIERPVVYAEELLEAYRRTYGRFWSWRSAAIETALLEGRIESVFGWPMHIKTPVNPRSIGNFPMQAAGSDMLRLACCYATERGVEVCAPVHDALAIEAEECDLAGAVDTTVKAMQHAGRAVLDGFEVRVEVKVVRYPNRYADPRGARMWSTVMGVLNELQALQTA